MIFLFDFANGQSVVLQAVPHFIAEYILVMGILILVLLSAFHKIIFLLPYVCLATLLCEMFFIQGSNQTFFYGSIAHTAFYEKVAFIGLIGSLSTCLLSLITNLKTLKVEYWIYLLTGQLALQILGLSQNWLLSFMAFELVSFVGYLLVLTRKEQKSSSESAIKYFIYGAFASGIMLFGISLYYGIHGNLILGNELKLTNIEKISLGFIMVGILFKLSIFPFHFWTPEVYHGAPAAIGAWLSTVSKLAGITLFYAIFQNIIPNELQLVLWVLSMITMLMGNLGILSQNHIYRLLGYSSIAHSGFLLMTMAIQQNFAQSTVLFYTLFSIPITFLTFYAISYFVKISQKTNFTEWSGIGRTNLLFTSFLIIGLAGLIGLPPTVGFIAKLYLVLPVWKEYTLSQNPLILILLVLFVLNTLLAFAAYFKIAILLLIRTPNQTFLQRINMQTLPAILWACGVLLFGLYGFDKILQKLML